MNPTLQSGPHPHSIRISADNRFAIVADRGADQVAVYRLDPLKGALTPNEPPYVKVKPGSGPRYLDIHPNGKFVYVINELQNSVTAFDYNTAEGVLKEVQTVPTLPKDFAGNNLPAHVHVHPSGKFLYGSNRGHDSIAVFQIDRKTVPLSPWRRCYARQKPTKLRHRPHRIVPDRRQSGYRQLSGLPYRPKDRRSDSDRTNGGGRNAGVHAVCGGPVIVTVPRWPCRARDVPPRP